MPLMGKFRWPGLLERFQVKRVPVHRPEMRRNKEIKHFGVSVKRGNALRRVVRRLSPALVAAAFVAGAAQAQAPETAKAPAASQNAQFVLQNGLSVVVLPDHRAPVVTQMLWFKSGAADDPPGMSGLAHFLEHMMFRGTRSVPDEGYSQAVTRAGGEDNAFTTHDYTVFFERVGRDKLRQIMHLEADRMQNLVITDNEVATERDVVLSERRQRVDNDAGALAEEQARAALYLSHPYGRPVIGWAEEIAHIGKADVVDFYRRHYAPNNAILVISGDVIPEKVREMAETEYGPVPARRMVRRSDYSVPERIGETRLSIAQRIVKVPGFLRIYRVPSYAEAAPGQAEALELAAELLGSGASSALYRKLVAERRLATDVAVSYDGYARDSGEFSISAEPRPGVSLDTLEAAINEALAAFLAHPPTKSALMHAQRKLIADTRFRQDSPYETAMAYGKALAIGLTMQDVEKWPDRIRTVTAAEVKKAADDGLNRRNSVTVHLTVRR